MVQVVPTNDDPAGVSDDGGESDTELHSSKRQRMDDPEEVLQDLKSLIWEEEITRGNGEASIDSLCVGTNRDQLALALEALEEEGRILSQEGIVYTMD